MTASATIALARALDRLAIDARRAPDDHALHDLLDQATTLGHDVAAFGIPDMTCVWHNRRADLWLRLGDFNAALADARAARTALGDLRKGDLLVDTLVFEARALEGQQDWPALDAVAKAGIAVVEAHRFNLTGDYLRAGYLRNRIMLYALGIKAAWKLDDIDGVIGRAELSKCRLVRQKQTETAQAIREELIAISQRITDMERQGRSADPLRARRQGLWDQYTRASAAEPMPTVGRMDQIQATLGPGEAVIYYYWITRHSLLRLVCDCHDVATSVTEIDRDQRTALDDYAAELGKDKSGRSPEFDLDTLDRFTSFLWPNDPAARAILDRADRLIISPHRVLHALPFGALRIGDEYVIARWAVRFAPNLGTLLQGFPADDRRSVLAVGIRDFAIGGVPLRSLKNAEPEADAIADLYRQHGWQATGLVGKTDEKRLRQAIADNAPSVLHLACHAENVSADTPLESNIVLSNTRLDGLEIPFLGLSAETVVLSACSAGQRAIGGRKMVELPGDDLQGIQAAFFAAGTRQIVAAHFAAQDYSSPIITQAFHAGLLAGDPVDIALAKAIRAYLKKHYFGHTARRDHWAFFFVVALGPNMPHNPNQSEQGSFKS